MGVLKILLACYWVGPVPASPREIIDLLVGGLGPLAVGLCLYCTGVYLLLDEPGPKARPDCLVSEARVQQVPDQMLAC